MAGRLILGIANPSLDGNGKPVSGSTLTFYENETTVLQSVYSTSDLQTPLPNPLTSDAAGVFPQVWAPDNVAYSVTWSRPGETDVTFDDIYATASAGGPEGRNRLINGDMRIDQRQSGAAATLAGPRYTLDRWALGLTQASKLSVQQNAGGISTPEGASPYYLGLVSQANYSVLSTDNFTLYQPIEGFNIIELGFGSSVAQSVTLSFLVYSSLTGTFGGALSNAGNDRSYPFTYNVPVANTWTPINVTIPGDTIGTWLRNGNAGITVFFGLGVGSGKSGPAGVWASADYRSAIGAVSVVGTIGAKFNITNVQFEGGFIATPFEVIDYATMLRRCQRYCLVLGGAAGAYMASGGAVSATQATFRIPVYNSMRAVIASVTIPTSAANFFATNGAGAGVASTAVGVLATANGKDLVVVDVTTAGGLTAGQVSHLYGNANADVIWLEAEL